MIPVIDLEASNDTDTMTTNSVNSAALSPPAISTFQLDKPSTLSTMTLTNSQPFRFVVPPVSDKNSVATTPGIVCLPNGSASHEIKFKNPLLKVPIRHFFNNDSSCSTAPAKIAHLNINLPKSQKPVVHIPSATIMATQPQTPLTKPTLSLPFHESTLKLAHQLTNQRGTIRSILDPVKFSDPVSRKINETVAPCPSAYNSSKFSNNESIGKQKRKKETKSPLKLNF